MRLKLTDRFCTSAKSRPGEPQSDYFDESVPGLALRVSASGRKAWTYHCTLRLALSEALPRSGTRDSGSAAKRVRLTLGTYPATGLGAARTLATGVRAELEAGRDPRTAPPSSLASVCEEYFAREGLRLRTGAYRKATLARLVYPQLGARPLVEVRRSDIVRLLDGIALAHGPVMADQTLAYLRRVFSWHEGRSDEWHSPIVRGMLRTRPLARERTLTDAELRIVWRGGAGVFGRFVRFLILTGARRNEAAGMCWSEITLSGDWTLPARRNKTKVDLVRPLSGLALSQLGVRLAEGGFVFSTDGGARPISGFSKFKRQLDASLPEPEGGGWRLHDLRRTARSLMSRVGVPSDHAERCLGHVIGGVRGTYDRHDWRVEKAAAFEALACEVERICGKPE